MEEKLANYRANRSTADKKSLFTDFIGGLTEKLHRKNLPEVKSSDISHDNINENNALPPEENEKLKPLLWISRILKFILWCLLLWLFVMIEFGLVFLIASFLYILYKSTRTRPKMDGEISAYSVFNENCESITGTFSADQFESQFRFRPQKK